MRSGIRLQLPERNVSTALPAEFMEPCLTVKDALNLIMSHRNVGPPNAERALRDACLSGKVSARHIRAIVNERGQKRIGILKVPRDAWQWSSAIDIETNSLSSFEHGKMESVQVNKAELSDWLSRQRRGPKAGTIARFAGPQPDKVLHVCLRENHRRQRLAAPAITPCQHSDGDAGTRDRLPPARVQYKREGSPQSSRENSHR